MSKLQTTDHPKAQCRCAAYDLYGLTVDQHDWLVDIEQRGVDGAADLMGTVFASADDGSEMLDGMAWTDLVDWVGRHNWKDPNAMYELAQRVVEAGKLVLAASEARRSTHRSAA